MDPENEGTQGTEQDSGAIGTGNQDRLDRLSAIADSHEREVASDFADVHDDDSTTPFQAPKLEGEDNTEGQPAPELEKEAAPDTSTQSEAKKFKVKINGVEREFTEEELIERASKIEAADEYLRKAKEAVEPPPQKQAGPTKEELQRLQDEEDKALARALQVGNEEEALAAIRKIREQASARLSLTPDDVARTIDQRLAFKDAMTAFRTEYKDIAEDKVLWNLAIQRDDEMIRNGDQRSYAERYTQIGDELRSWVKSKMPAVPPAAPTLDNKEAKKAAVPRVPTPASRKAPAAAPEDDKEESTQDIIANMAKSRGGPQWMRG